MYDNNLLRNIGMRIPCVHMPALPMALNVIKEFKVYIEKCKEENISYDQILNKLNEYLEKNGK
jgi:hypothetical protein